MATEHEEYDATDLVVELPDGVSSDVVVHDTVVERDDSVQFLRDGRVQREVARRLIIDRNRKTDAEAERWFATRSMFADMLSGLLGGVSDAD